MNATEILKEYLRLSDVMYQSLKVHKYEIFDKALSERGKIADRISSDGNLFTTLKSSEKRKWKKALIDADNKIESAMTLHRKKLEKELSFVHASRAKLRKHSNVKNYYSKNLGNQGRFINKLK